MPSPASERPVCFISDAHLGARIRTCERREKDLIGFLNEAALRFRALYILGDLFDFWVEYKYAIRPDYFSVLHAFRSLIEAGTDVHYVTGNHDFAIGPFLHDTLGMHIHHDHFESVIDGKKFHFYHGDGLVKDDVGYRVLKKILRNKLNQRLYRLLHPTLGITIATFFSGSSRKLMALRINESRLREYRDAAWRYLAEGNDIVMFGHTHRAELLTRGDKIYCNTGQWIRAYNYAALDHGELSLWEYLPGRDPQRIASESWK
jgi:UDP-2,3-diacylglucosamine hydrolase